MQGYNGWAGKIRDVRGASLYANIGVELPHYTACVLCNQPASNVTMTYHTEEYGSTYEDYLANAKALCPHCHGMIHMRYRLRGRFQRFKQRLSMGEEGISQLHVFKTLGHFFMIAPKMSDLYNYPEHNSGHDWLDALPMTSYKGPEKIATSDHPEYGEIPDPKVYGRKWDRIEGVVVRASGIIEEVSWEKDSQFKLF